MVYKPTEETRRKGVAKRRRIIDVAHGLLSTGGFAAATVRRTADGAGISTGSVYSYFGSRDELLAELFRELASHEFAVVDQTVRAAEPAARQRLTALVETFARRALHAPQTAESLLFEPVNPLVEAERLKFRRRYHGLIVEILEQGIGDGTLPAQDPEVSARAITGAIAEALMGRLSPEPSEADPETLIANIVTFCIRAVASEQ